MGPVGHPVRCRRPRVTVAAAAAARMGACRMTRELAEGEFGPPIAFREYSLLENPGAAELKKGVLALDVCKVSASWEAWGEGAAAAGGGSAGGRAGG